MYPRVSSGLADIVPAITDRLPVILAEVRDLLADEHPDYASFLAEEFDDVVASARGFASRLVGVAENAPDGAPSEDVLEQTLFEEIGREHFRQGQDLGGLLAAYRAGAAVAWRHVAQVALSLDASSEALAGLASTVFTAVDRLSTASLRGYAQEQSESVLARDRLREELAELLLSDRSDTATIRAVAARAEWPLPHDAAVVLVDPDNQAARAALARLEPACLRIRGPRAGSLGASADGAPGLVGAIVPDPSGPRRRARLANLLRGADAVVGSTVPLDRLPASLRVAEIAVRLRRTHVLTDDPLFVGEHLDALIVHHDERLLAALRRQYLAPLDDLPAPTRDRLATTLTSWLLHMGNRQAMAGELHVHPQTVRYRMAQLRELFGPALDDPSIRATLLLALAWGPAADESEPADAVPETTNGSAPHGGGRIRSPRRPDCGAGVSARSER
ncbi:PucR family transcriptional regulator [Pseudonocardia acaciae]|uniref:PucR family transcriptional regulator n=1 Tax=Pseudonocardia acaciae TaxID=551276 RepID=UPI000A873AE7|nr:helix-turn-helix domain-containing protein [Pseudonocardia acaciae]